MFDYNETKWDLNEDEKQMIEEVQADKTAEDKTEIKTLLLVSTLYYVNP